MEENKAGKGHSGEGKFLQVVQDVRPVVVKEPEQGRKLRERFKLRRVAPYSSFQPLEEHVCRKQTVITKEPFVLVVCYQTIEVSS